MNGDDFDLFKKETSDVAPIQQTKINIRTPFSKPTPAQIARQRAATKNPSVDPNILSTEYVDFVNPHDILEFKRDGVQEGVYRKLRLGKYEVDAVLDLHRKKLEQARRDVFEFIRDCVKLDLRTVMILHGKGVKSTPPALLKSYVNKWLPELAEVLAFHSAAAHHGGVGAVYILLRKSDRKKQENRERHLRRAAG